MSAQMQDTYTEEAGHLVAAFNAVFQQMTKSGMNFSFDAAPENQVEPATNALNEQVLSDIADGKHLAVK